jgi:hypothetical protein
MLRCVDDEVPSLARERLYPRPFALCWGWRLTARNTGCIPERWRQQRVSTTPGYHGAGAVPRAFCDVFGIEIPPGRWPVCGDASVSDGRRPSSRAHSLHSASMQTLLP